MVSEETVKNTIKYSSLVVLAIQNTAVFMMMKYVMSEHRPKFIKEISVCYAEVLKLVASVIFCCLSHRSMRTGLTEIYIDCVHKKKDFAKVLIPAAVFTIVSILQYVAVENLPTTTVAVVFQLRIITTAIFSVVILKKPLSGAQWIALFVLFMGICIVQYDLNTSENKASNTSNTTVFNTTATSQSNRESHVIGIAAILVACVLNGFAAIYFEKILKAIFKGGFNPVSVSSNLMEGFDWAVWITVVLNALGGLMVAIVIKYADNLRKAFAASFAIILNCIFAYFLFSFHPTFRFGVGTFFVIASVVGYTIYPYRSSVKPADIEVEVGKGDWMEDDGKEKNEEEIPKYERM